MNLIKLTQFIYKYIKINTMKSYHLENIAAQQKKDPRHFLKPTNEELDSLQVGELVRIFFIFDFKPNDGCRAERMWLEISEINGESYKGLLTNEPIYIKDLQVGDLVEFKRDNIATVIIKSDFEEKKLALISIKALKAKEINWLVRDEPDNAQDSGWQLFYGDESESYLNEPNNCVIISLEEALQLEPRLEKVFLSEHDAFEWSDAAADFIAVQD